MHQWRIMSFYIYSTLYFWFFSSEVSRVMKPSSFLTFALHKNNVLKDKNHMADVPSRFALSSASRSLLPWNTFLHLFMSLVPSFSNEGMILKRPRDRHVSIRAMQTFPLCVSLFLAVFSPAASISLQRCLTSRPPFWTSAICLLFPIFLLTFVSLLLAPCWFYSVKKGLKLHLLSGSISLHCVHCKKVYSETDGDLWFFGVFFPLYNLCTLIEAFCKLPLNKILCHNSCISFQRSDLVIACGFG